MTIATVLHSRCSLLCFLILYIPTSDFVDVRIVLFFIERIVKSKFMRFNVARHVDFDARLVQIHVVVFVHVDNVDVFSSFFFLWQWSFTYNDTNFCVRFSSLVKTKKKVINYKKTVNIEVCGKKDVQNIYLYWVEKNDLFGLFLEYRRRYVTKTMKQVWKEGGGNRNVKLQCFPYTRCSFALNYSPVLIYRKHCLLDYSQYHCPPNHRVAPTVIPTFVQTLIPIVGGCCFCWGNDVVLLKEKP